MAHIVKAPARLALATNVYDMRWDRIDLSYEDRCIIDMTECTFGEPLPLMIFATKCRDLIRNNPRVIFTLRTRPSDFRGYADHIGMFRFMGFPRGNMPNSARSSKTFIPISVFQISKIKEQAADAPIGKFIQVYSRKMAQILSQEKNGETYDLFEYCLREMMRNAAEHSNGKNLVVFGQYWPVRGNAEIVICDDGVGVAEKLYENEYINCSTNREALKFAILPGISGVSRQERFQQDEFWGNSGFGLYVTSRFCSEFGSFRMISGNDGLTLANGYQTEHPWTFPGTCVQLQFSTKKAAGRVSRIGELVEEGKNEFKEILGDFPIQPSAASKFLASHFEKSDI